MEMYIDNPSLLVKNFIHTLKDRDSRIKVDYDVDFISCQGPIQESISDPFKTLESLKSMESILTKWGGKWDFSSWIVFFTKALPKRARISIGHITTKCGFDYHWNLSNHEWFLHVFKE